jgi:hypothetical protein
MDSWNAIGKQWLFCFLCKCSAIKGSDIASIPKYHRDAIQAWIIIFFSHVLNDPVPFIIQSIKYSLIFNRGFIIFVPYIVYVKYIISQKRLEKVDFY